MDLSDPLENYRAIREEVKLHDINLADRPEIIAVSKAELPDATEVRDALAEATGRPVLLFSSVTGAGLKQLIEQTYALLAETRQST
jgi:GTP-binding protein